ncbi:alpha-amylase family glycosyl hydrolase [Rhodohalobacter sp.]|uniref:alpha-amylase family glycosyl hydrolase n=1 Tax=Rhodohalobacter sp. TaxID=1974210 RepID=UPI002ACE484F|nr:alpha-amylase family glycosyl hydrolase [Rhodohalobacter sp.]MDZ7757642.1 alpha-amylase family glycosyl hydrolase [Rhodohalobacter sp.]
MKRTRFESKPGVTFTDNATNFCIYCPHASAISCILFDAYDAENGVPHSMQMDADGYWQVEIQGDQSGRWYAYDVEFADEESKPDSPYINEHFADPYSKHVTVRNTYRQDARSYIYKDDFDWEGDTHCFPDDPRDLIIYETHLKDLTAHPSSKAKGKGFYQKFTDPNQKGGINYLKRLGINCVEFLPLHKFPPIEPPFEETTPEGFQNSWNPYSTNYWGYMTSFFFAPESSFASDYSNRFSGKTTAAVTELKEVVKQLHKENMTVIMDVVFNHTSLFDVNPLTHLCPDEYLRSDENGELLNRSGTGNEFRSENPVARQLIVDSLLYWIEEYHIDGFRFDLAALLDRKSWDVIRNKVHEKYPKTVLIAEPWGGYYSPQDFSNHDWASWNDRIRNSIKGSNPMQDKGFIFSEWQHETRRERLENIFKGTLNHGEGGLYNTSAHSVNYLESHDGYTLGDFIRIGLKPELQDEKITDREKHVKLNPSELKIAKLAALTLFTAQGITMIHTGQEFARSKIIAKTPYPDDDVGKMDHNSYQKNNETNWINFDDIRLNSSLFDYYRGLIQIRKHCPALSRCEPHEISFEHYGNPLVITFYISGNESGDLNDYYVLLNASANEKANCRLPEGTWEVIANKDIVSIQSVDIASGTVKIEPQSGMLLRKLRH